MPSPHMFAGGSGSIAQGTHGKVIEGRGVAAVVAASAGGSDAVLRAVLAVSGGDPLALEGWVGATFQSEHDAFLAATELRLSAPRDSRGAIAVRVAVSGTGHEEGSGGAVDRACAIAELAGPGDLIVDSSIRSAIEDESLRFGGAVQQAGAAAPLNAWRRLWTPARAPGDRPELPEGVRAAARPWGLFGRAGDLAVLEGGWRRAATGRRGLVIVAGEAGIGKTRLTAEAATEMQRAGACVLYGRYDAQTSVAHQGLSEALEHLARQAPREVLAGFPNELALLSSLAPGFRSHLAENRLGGALDPSAPHLLHLALANVLSAAARWRPLALILDDVHAADRSSLMLLRALLLGPTPIAGLAILSHRPDELSEEGGALLADLATRLSAPVVEPRGLSGDEIAALAAQLAPEFAGEAGELSREAGGNPLLATEFLRGAGAAPMKAPGERERLRIPSSVHHAVSARIGQLAPPVRDLLGLAAVIGREFDVDVLVESIVAGPGFQPAELDAAVAAGLIEHRAASRYRFAHAMIQRSLYEARPPAARGAAHRAVAEALERLVDRGVSIEPAELAHHWAEAQPPDSARTLVWTERAATAALERWDPASAARLYERALALCDAAGEPAVRRADLLIGLGTAQRHDGEPRFRETLLQAGALARQAADSALLVRAALANSRGITSSAGRVDQDRVGLLEQAADAVAGERSPERAQLLAALAQELTFAGDPVRRTQLSDEAVALARTLDDRATLVFALVARFMPTWVPQTFVPRFAESGEAVEVAEALDDPLQLFLALHWRVVVLIQAGELADAVAVVERAERLARRLGDATARWLAALQRANLALIAGHHVRAERLAERGFALGNESGQPDALVFHASLLACIRWEQGRLGELLPAVEAAVEHNPGIPGFRSVLALAAVEAGELDRARRVIADEATDDFARLPTDPVWLPGVATYAHACAGARLVEPAAKLYELLEPFAGRVVYTGVSAWGEVEWALGRLAATMEDLERAEGHLAAAAERAGRIGAPVWRARTELELAAVLRAQGRGEELARDLVAAAAARAARMGAAAVERQARLAAGADAGRAAGVELAETPLRKAGLTRRQIDVLRLVAAGCTNAEVGEALGISPATVKRHVEGVFRALGVGNRAAAVARALAIVAEERGP